MLTAAGRTPAGCGERFNGSVIRLGDRLVGLAPTRVRTNRSPVRRKVKAARSCIVLEREATSVLMEGVLVVERGTVETVGAVGKVGEKRVVVLGN